VGDEEQRRSHAGHWLGFERHCHEVTPIIIEHRCYLPEAEEMGACGCCEPTTGAQSWSVVGLKVMMRSKVSSGQDVVAESASEVSSTAWGRLIPDVRQCKPEIRNSSGLANHVLSIQSKFNGRDLLWVGTPSPPTHTFISSIDIQL
jgi:hypothetical protein